MAQSAWPFGDQSVTDEQFRRWARSFAETKIHEGLTVSANSTGMQVQAAAGFATVQGSAFYNSSAATVSIGPNSTSQPRVDTVVLRLDYTLTPQIQLAVVQGTPRSNPTAPALTQTDLGRFEVPLGDVTVPAGAVTISAGNVTSRPSGIGYRWVGGKLKLWDADDVSNLIKSVNATFYTVFRMSARLSGGVVSVLFTVVKKTDWGAPAWGVDPLFSLDSAIRSQVDDLDVPCVNNAADNAWGFQLNQDSIKLRRLGPGGLLQDTNWLSVGLNWPIA